jgi:hypothetical protein
MKVVIVLIFVGLFYLKGLKAYEIDPHNCYVQVAKKENLKPTEDALNKFTQDKITQAIVETNEVNLNYKKSGENSNKKCDGERLKKALKNKLDDQVIGEVEEFADEKLPENLKCTVLYKNSIYASSKIDLKIGKLLTHFGKKGLESEIFMCNTRIGVDKLGHFMAQGYSYYELRQKGEQLITALGWGEESENMIYGLLTTGVKSYGDLSSNYQGMLFWDQVYSPDGNGPLSLVKCVNGKFAKTERSFNWCDYVNPSWDEANNCSEFSSDLSEVVDQNLQKLSQQIKSENPVSCPRDPAECGKAILFLKKMLREDFKIYHKYLLHETCYISGQMALAEAKSSNPKQNTNKELEKNQK